MTKPVTLEKAKARLGIRSDHRDAEIQGLIDAAIEHVEKAAHYYLEQRDQVEALDCLVGAVDLKAWPVSAVGDITYLDEDDQDATIANARLISLARRGRELAGRRGAQARGNAYRGTHWSRGRSVPGSARPGNPTARLALV